VGYIGGWGRIEMGWRWDGKGRRVYRGLILILISVSIFIYCSRDSRLLVRLGVYIELS
jgi:hypothetical protein